MTVSITMHRQRPVIPVRFETFYFSLPRNWQSVLFQMAGHQSRIRRVTSMFRLPGPIRPAIQMP